MIKVLYVDDEPALCEIGKIFLEEMGGLSVFTASGPIEALQALHETPFDIIVSDYQMPGMNGIEFLTEVRKKYGSIPFVLFTGKGREDVAIEAINQKADYYIQKGGDPKSQFAELIHHIKQAITNKKAHDKIKKINSRNREMIANIGDVIVITDERGDITFISDNIEQHYYWNPKDLIGKNFTNVIHPDDQERALQDVKKLLTVKNFEISGTYKTIDKKNNTRSVFVTVKNMMHNPEINGFLVNFRDISRQVEDADKISEQAEDIEFVNAIILKANDATSLQEVLEFMLQELMDLLQFDIGGVYLVDFSTRMANVVYSENLSRDNKDIAWSVPIDEPPFRSIFIDNTSIYTTDFENNHLEIVTKMGYKSLVCIPIISHGIAIGAFNIASKKNRPMPENKQVLLESIGRELGNTIHRLIIEQKEKQISQDLKTLFNSIHEMIFILDMQGTIININPTVLEKLHYTKKELVGMDVLDLHVPDRREEACSIMQGMIAGTTDVCQVPIRAKDGTVVEVETSISHGMWNEKKVIIGVSRDITHRKQVERRLSRLEHEYQILLKESFDPIFSFYPDGTYRFVNQAFATGVGKTVDEVIGKTIWDVFPKEEADRRFSIIREVLSTGVEKEIEVMVHLNGKDTWYLTSVRPATDAENNITIVNCSSKDITRIKKTEDELLFKNALLKVQHDTSPVGTLVIDSDKNVINYNWKFLDIWNIPKEVIIQGNDNTLLDYVIQNVKDPEEFLEKVKYLYTNRDEVCRDEISLQDGRTLSRYSAPMYSESSEFYGRAWHFQDITVQRDRESALKRSEELFSTAFYHSPHLIAISDIPTGRYLDVNDTFADLMGYTRDEIIGKTSIELGWFTPEFREDIKQELKDHGKITRDVLSLPKKNGELVWIQHSGVVIDIAGTTRLLNIAIDITRQKKDAEALLESKELFETIFYNGPTMISISELETGKFLEVNDKFSEICGYSREDLIGNTSTEVGWLTTEDRALLYSEIQKTGMISGNDFRGQKKNGDVIWTRYFGKVITISGKHQLISSAIDITNMKAQEELLQKKCDFQDLIISMAKPQAITPGNVSSFITDSLQKIGQFTHADRVYIFTYNFDQQTATNTHEWCATGITPEIDTLQGVPLNEIAPAWISSHRKGKPVYISDTATIKNAYMREHLRRQNIKSLLTIPMMDNGTCTGFVGLDSVRHHSTYSSDDRNLLTIFAHMMANLQKIVK